MKRWIVTKFFLFTLSLFTAQGHAENNYFEAMNQNRSLFTIQNEIYNKIQLAEIRLIRIKERPITLMEKWQELLQVILPIQIDVIKTHNFEGNQAGLSKFNEEFSRC
jgi:hypothetical protein